MIMLINNGWNSGLREWLLQRLTAVYMIFYIIFLLFFFIFHDNIDYFSIKLLFTSFIFKIFTLLFIFNLVLHASIGINIIINDYIKENFTRTILDFITNSILISYIFYIMQILWSLK